MVDLSGFQNIEWVTIWGWVTAAALATIISTCATVGVNYYWERRKLMRSERMSAYADYLAADSERWRAFKNRDGAKKRGPEGAEAQASADKIVQEARDRMWDAYSRAQLVAQKGLVSTMLACIRLSDDRQRAYKMGQKSPGDDQRAAAIRNLVTQGRKDLGLRKLPDETFKKS